VPTASTYIPPNRARHDPPPPEEPAVTQVRAISAVPSAQRDCSTHDDAVCVSLDARGDHGPERVDCVERRRRLGRVVDREGDAAVGMLLLPTGWWHYVKSEQRSVMTNVWF